MTARDILEKHTGFKPEDNWHFEAEVLAAMDEVIEIAICRFEDIKLNKAKTMQDLVQLDGTLAVLDALKAELFPEEGIKESQSGD